MIKRVVTKIGDIFSVEVDDDSIKYFQLIAFDLTQLNSDVIRVFKKEFPTDMIPDCSELLSGEVEFYAHCITKLGVKLGYWEKVGRCVDVGETEHVLFRTTPDYGRAPGEERVRVSDNWYVWKIGGPMINVNRLEGENRSSEIGIVMNPESIVQRIKYGEYQGSFPGFE